MDLIKTKNKNKKMDLIKNKKMDLISFSTAKETINKTKRQPSE